MSSKKRIEKGKKKFMLDSTVIQDHLRRFEDRKEAKHLQARTLTSTEISALIEKSFAASKCPNCGLFTLKNRGYYWDCQTCGQRWGRQFKADPKGFNVYTRWQGFKKALLHRQKRNRRDYELPTPRCPQCSGDQILMREDNPQSHNVHTFKRWWCLWCRHPFDRSDPID